MKLNFIQIFTEFWAYANLKGLWLNMPAPILKAKGVYRDFPFVIYGDQKVERIVIVVDGQLVKIAGNFNDNNYKPTAKLMNKPSGTTLTKLALRL